MVDWKDSSINPPKKGQYNVQCDSDNGKFVTALHWNGKHWCFDNMGVCGEPLFSGVNCPLCK